MAADGVAGVCAGGGQEETLFPEGQVLAHSHEIWREEGSGGRGGGTHLVAAGLPGTAYRQTLSRPTGTSAGATTAAADDPPPSATVGKAGGRRGESPAGAPVCPQQRCQRCP